MMRMPKVIPGALLVWTLLFAVGCTHRYQGQVVLQPGDHARFRLIGSRCELKINNLGPGTATLQFVADDGTVYGRETLGASSMIYRVRRSFLEAVATNESEESLSLDFDGRAPEGLAYFLNDDRMDRSTLDHDMEIFRQED